MVNNVVKIRMNLSKYFKIGGFSWMRNHLRSRAEQHGEDKDESHKIFQISGFLWMRNHFRSHAEQRGEDKDESHKILQIS